MFWDECIQPIRKIGEIKLRIQHKIEFLYPYNFSMSYRHGKINVNADFLSRLPFPLTEEDIPGSCALSDPDEHAVYLVRTCGFIPYSCPIPNIVFGGLDQTFLPTTSCSRLVGRIPPTRCSDLEWVTPDPR